MNYASRLTLVVAAALALGACSNGTTSTDSGPGQDASITDTGAPDAAVTDSTPSGDGAACVSTVPNGTSPQYCATPGCAFRPVTLTSCDSAGGDYQFYGADYCQVKATVVIVSAGWCVPCMMEAPQIQAQITEAFAGMGVRVITVYAQNPDASTPTAPHCTMWANQFHLTSHMTIDPMGLTQVYTPGNAFPSNIVIDQHGIIYDVGYGSDIARLVADVQAILASQP